MEPEVKKKWYTKKRYLLIIGTLALFAIRGQSTPISAPLMTPVVKQTQSTENQRFNNPSKSPQTAPILQSNKLSNNNSYVNSDGNTIHSPAYSNTIPQGASAQCRDGTYSFSQHRRGTCSRHGGVSEWL